MWQMVCHPSPPYCHHHHHDPQCHHSHQERELKWHLSTIGAPRRWFGLNEESGEKRLMV